MRVIPVLATTVIVQLLGHPGAAALDPLDAILRGTTCAAQVRQALAEFDARLDEARLEPSDPFGTMVVHLPTGAIGRWIRLRTGSRDGSRAVLERITARTIEGWTLSRDCRLTADSPLRTSDPPTTRPLAFDDGALVERLAAGGRGLILLWSPHMPLSVDQYEVLRQLGATSALSVVPVLDPSADRGYAERVAQARGLPADALRPLAGIELALRGMVTHAPSVQVFKDGRLVGPVLFGYRGLDAARLAVANFLDAGP